MDKKSQRDSVTRIQWLRMESRRGVRGIRRSGTRCCGKCVEFWAVAVTPPRRAARSLIVFLKQRDPECVIYFSVATNGWNFRLLGGFVASFRISKVDALSMGKVSAPPAASNAV